jgi:chromosome segregation ATPase
VWQRVGIGGDEPSFAERPDANRRLDMTTTTIEDELAEASDRIERLRKLAQAEGPAERLRIRRHLDVLQQEEASVRAAARHTPGDVKEKLGQLRTRLHVAEQSVAADLADDWATFAAAVAAELRRWDTYLERLQTRVAARAWQARAEAESAIGEVRGRRIEVDERLAQARAAGGAARADWQPVTAARDELEQKADELSARLT